MHDAAGKEVGRSEARGQADAARSNVTVALPPIALAQATLWSPARPTLYEVTTTLTAETIRVRVRVRVRVRACTR